MYLLQIKLQCIKNHKKSIWIINISINKDQIVGDGGAICPSQFFWVGVAAIEKKKKVNSGVSLRNRDPVTQDNLQSSECFNKGTAEKKIVVSSAASI